MRKRELLDMIKALEARIAALEARIAAKDEQQKSWAQLICEELERNDREMRQRGLEWWKPAIWQPYPSTYTTSHAVGVKDK